MRNKSFKFNQNKQKPLIIAGPCMAESKELLDETASFLKEEQDKLGFDLVFKASFDKANRTNIHSIRGRGMDLSLEWMSDVASRYDLYLTTDVHETYQVEPVSQVVDLIQIPAFLSRQTDLIVKSAMSKKAVNVKKGQFMSPYIVGNIVEKVASCYPDKTNISELCAITERGFSFGYQDLVVDMRSFPIMKKASGCPIIFDITHSTQQPPSINNTTLGNRWAAPILTRSCLMTGCVDGFFMEVHPKPSTALSDSKVQLSFKQASYLLEQICDLWIKVKDITGIDQYFID